MEPLTIKKTLVVAFDIETAGPTKDQNIIGIGVSAINSQTLEEVDSCFIPGYFPGVTKFHPDTWNGFWSNHQDKLQELEYKGDSSEEERQKEMIVEFQNFRARMEQKYFDKEFEDYELVADNHAFDACVLNRYIEKYLPGQKPLPNTATFVERKDKDGNVTKSQAFDRFHKTRSMQRGMLIVVDPSFIRDNKSGKSYFPRICELYDVPKMKKEHDHNPVNDAYATAFEHCVLIAIQDRTIKPKQ